MRDEISCLRLRLAEAEEDTSCAALNRLRAKLRELMKDGQKADQQVPVSKSREDLRVVNCLVCSLSRARERANAVLTRIRRHANGNSSFVEG